MINSINIVEMVLWGLVALIVQVLVYLFIRLPMPRISERIEAGESPPEFGSAPVL